MGYGRFWVLLVLPVLFLAGCASTTYEQPEKVTPTQEPVQETVVKAFKVGETASNGKLSITVNSQRYTKIIDEQNNEFLVAEADAGNIYLILDVTIQNLQTGKTESLSTVLQMKVTDSEGYAYGSDFDGFSLAKYCKACDGQLLPGMKARGEVAFKVPENASGLRFLYLYDLLGTTAVFEL